MPTQLPVDDSPYFSLLVDLGETTYETTYRWNEREGAWYFDLAEQNGVMIVSGQKIVPNISITKRWAFAKMPEGEIAIYSQAPNERPTRDSLSEGTVQLWYYTPEEL